MAAPPPPPGPSGPRGQTPLAVQQRITGAVVGALVLLLYVLWVALGEVGAPGDGPVAWLFLGVGTASAVAGVVVGRRPLPADTEQVVAAWRTRAFLAIGLTELAALLGFVASFLVEAVWPYLIGLGVTLVALWVVRPSEGKARADHQDLQRRGSRADLLADLTGQPR